MAALAWLVAPVLADRFAGTGIVPMFKALIVCLCRTRLAVRSRRDPRRPRAADAPLVDGPRGALASLPTKPAQRRVGGRVWLIVIPLDLGRHRCDGLIPTFPAPENRVLATLVGSDTGQAFLDGAWGWYALLLAMFIFNTVLGEELLFRGYLLPRMNGAFGRGDWVVNGLLFTVYHLHVPWVMPGTLIESFLSLTRQSATEAPGSGSRCTALRACSLRSPCS